MIKKILVVLISVSTSFAFILFRVPNVSEAEINTTLANEEKEQRLVIHFVGVPLEQSLQNHIVELCKIYNVPPSLVFAVIEQESSYNPNALNYSEDCFGLMQIHECNFTTYNLDEPYNAFENVRVGITILSELLNKYEDVNKALMAYNCGEYGARRLWNKGITSNSYSRSVLDKQDKINESERVYYYVEEN